MKIAIISRGGECFPNIISKGLQGMLRKKNIETTIFNNAIPMLMRLLPLNQQPKHWNNNLQFRLRNKIKYYLDDKKLINEFKSFDAIILSECFPNAFWRNYLCIEELKKIIKKPILSYTDAAIEAAPLHCQKWFTEIDYGSDRYFLNLFPSDVVEKRISPNGNNFSVGLNISDSGLQPITKEKFCAVIDFEQAGYELYKTQQIRVLKKMNIPFIELKGRYPIEEIRKIYSEASIFFLAFPETFGLPIAECLATGCYIFTPNSGWPMAWRLDNEPKPWGAGDLPDCFCVYSTDDELEKKINEILVNYHISETPQKVYKIFLQYYNHLYFGNNNNLDVVLKKIANYKNN